MQEVPEEVDMEVRSNRGSVYRYQAPRDTVGLERIDTNVENVSKQVLIAFDHGLCGKV